MVKKEDIVSKKTRELEFELKKLRERELPLKPYSNNVKVRKVLEEKFVLKRNYTVDELIKVYELEIIKLQLIKNNGFTTYNMKFPELTELSYKMLYQFALFLSDNKIALECCSIKELGDVFKYYRKESLEQKIYPRMRDQLKDIQNKSKLQYGEEPII